MVIFTFRGWTPNAIQQLVTVWWLEMLQATLPTLIKPESQSGLFCFEVIPDKVRWNSSMNILGG